MIERELDAITLADLMFNPEQIAVKSANSLPHRIHCPEDAGTN